MANLIKIKRSLDTSIPVSLANGELAFTANGDILYIGSNDAIVAIASKRTPGVLTANQGLVANSTGMLDVIRLGNSTVNAVVNSTSIRVANSTTSITLTNPTSGQISGGDYFLNADGTWKQASSGGASTLNDLSDVTISTPSNNQLLVYDNATSQWKNQATGNGFTFTSFNMHLLANNGILANTTGVWARQANGISVDASGINVLVAAAAGLISNTTGVWVKPANGISVDSSGVNVLAPAAGALISNTTGVWVRAGTGVTVNSTGVHVGQAVETTSDVTFRDITARDVNISGNLNVAGTLTTIDTVNMAVNDSIIELARNNSSNVIDLGWFGQYNDGTERFAGLVWDASTNLFELFANTTVAPTTTVDTGGTGFVRAMLRTYLNTGALISNSIAVTIAANSTVAVNITGNTLTLTTALVGPSGGTGLATYTAEDIIVANSTNGFRKLTLGADGLVLQSNGTVLKYDSLDGGTF